MIFGSLLLLALGACSDRGTGPVVDEVLPESARRGEVVEVLGDRFCDDIAQNVDEEGICLESVAAFVSFGARRRVVRAEAVRFGQRRITVKVPEDVEAGETYIAVARDGIHSNPVAFEVLVE